MPGYEPVGTKQVGAAEVLDLCRRSAIDAVLLVPPDEALAAICGALAQHMPALPVLVAGERQIAPGDYRNWHGRCRTGSWRQRSSLACAARRPPAKCSTRSDVGALLPM